MSAQATSALQEHILEDFFVLVNDATRIRYFNKAHAWLRMAWNATPCPADRPADVLGEMVRLQREHEGLVNGQAVMEELRGIRGMLEKLVEGKAE